MQVIATDSAANAAISLLIAGASITAAA